MTTITSRADGALDIEFEWDVNHDLPIAGNPTAQPEADASGFTNEEHTFLSTLDAEWRGIFLDRYAKTGTFDPPVPIKPRSSIPSDLDIELYYRDPVVTPVVSHANDDWWSMLEEMTAIELADSVPAEPSKITIDEDPDGKRDTEVVVIEGAPALDRGDMSTLNRRRQAHAERTARYQWNDDFFEQRNTPMQQRRGRIYTGPILTFGGEDVNICVSRSFIPDGDSWKDRFVVFLRQSLGRDAKGFITWEYRSMHVFEHAPEGLEWADRMYSSLRNEITLEDHWYSAQFAPGEALPYDPSVLASIVEHGQASPHLAG